MCKANPYRAVFLERDGVLSEALTDQYGHWRSPLSVAEFRVREEAAIHLKPLCEKKYRIFAFTYQPLVGKGELSRTAVQFMNSVLHTQLPLVEGICMCVHDPADSCTCKRGQPGLFLEAQVTYHLNLRQSFVVSDKWQDGRAGLLAQCTPYLIQSPWVSAPTPSGTVVPDLKTAVSRILHRTV